ncbi:Uncharacterised protein [Trueperella bialowiezensis]|uniref:BCR, YitT family n=2 Tax=Trueperella bialowiezensis TaxID=312285 RepID=A0A3S4VA62_9ACTO|nr:Uncharacterised protein [Trueperella bialowiezensis]
MLAIGLAFITQSGLGTSAIGSPMWVFSVLTSLSFGMWNFIFNVAFVVLQWVLLRKDFPLWYWIQIPIAMFFSGILDLTMNLLAPYVPQQYQARLLFLFAGVFIVAVGVAFEVATSKYFLPGEGIVSAIAKVGGWPFPKVKVIFDVSLVAFAIVASLLLFGRVEGVREGTVIAAVFTGVIVGWIQRPIDAAYAWFVGAPPSDAESR